jgi:hypothetical protein
MKNNSTKYQTVTVTPPPPLTAILVSIKKDKEDIQHTLNTPAQKWRLPSGPALINGQWIWEGK